MRGKTTVFQMSSFLLLTLVLVRGAEAGKYNPTLNVGDAAPVWKDLSGTDGKKHSLADLKGKKVVVLVFTCNSCPVAIDYENRIIELAKKHAGPKGQVEVVAVNVNTVPEDSLARMTERAKEKGYPFPYLFDGSQKIARDYGATFTPEFFVLDEQRKIVYMGAMDDNGDEAKRKIDYVEAAIVATLAGKKVEVTETVGRGCFVRYARQRRKK